MALCNALNNLQLSSYTNPDNKIFWCELPKKNLSHQESWTPLHILGDPTASRCSYGGLFCHPGGVCLRCGSFSGFPTRRGRVVHVLIVPSPVVLAAAAAPLPRAGEAVVRHRRRWRQASQSTRLPLTLNQGEGPPPGAGRTPYSRSPRTGPLPSPRRTWRRRSSSARPVSDDNTTTTNNNNSVTAGRGKRKNKLEGRLVATRASPIHSLFRFVFSHRTF